MKFSNKNKKAINDLISKMIKKNKLRNIFIIIAVILTTVLFTSLFTIGTGIIEAQEYTSIRTTGTSTHVSFGMLNKEKLNKLVTNPLIKEYGYTIPLSRIENEELSKIYSEIRYGTENEAKIDFSYPTEGKMPEEYDEIAVDTKVLDMLNVPHNIGEKVKLKYKIGDEERNKEFILCGFWEKDEISPSSIVWVSKNFVENELRDINYSYENNIILNVIFNNSFMLDQKAQRIVSESGYSNEKDSKDSIQYKVNSAYESININDILEIFIPVFILCFLVIVSGYLIIYNIFQISVANDIRDYGLLKTIGATKNQIKILIQKQAIILCILGIPTGLIIGFLISKILFSKIISTSNCVSEQLKINPIVFIAASLFSIITVCIGSNKPGKVAGSVSPVQAIKYRDVTNIYKKNSIRKSRTSKIYKIALYNLQRNKKKTVIVTLSIALSIVLLNCIYTFTNSFCIDKVVSRDIVTDFVVGNSNYFNVHKSFRTENDVVSESIIDKIKQSDNLKDSGRIYYSLEDTKIKSEEKNELQLYGMDDFPLTKLDVIEGSMDENKLKSGNYILEAVSSNDNGEYDDEYYYKVGDTVKISYKNTEKEYKVMAVVGVNHSLNVRYYYMDGISMILPSNEFCSNIEKPTTMSYVYDVNDLNKGEEFIKNYIDNIERDMDYISKQTLVKGFDNFKDTIYLSGLALTLIIGLIGIINFINSILASMITRKREFAIMESIGMTKKQLKKMIVLEALYYAGLTLFITLILSALLSKFVLNKLIDSVWFCKYIFTLSPILVISPIIVLFAVITPLICYKAIDKFSIVERLREVD